MVPLTRTFSPSKTDSGARASAMARSTGGREPPTTTVFTGIFAAPRRRDTASTPASPLWRPSVTTTNPAISSNGISAMIFSNVFVRSVDDRNASSRAAAAASVAVSGRAGSGAA